MWILKNNFIYMLLSNNEINIIALKYNCKVFSNKLIYLNENKYLGKIYTKENSKFYHATTANKFKIEGDVNFETVLVNFLRIENIIK